MTDISIALGGGGAKGNAHIGVLRRLEKEGYRIRAVAGTSFGGLVASLYAAGRSPDEIEEIFSQVDQTTLYTRRHNEGPALLGLSNVDVWLDQVLGDITFEDLKIPCALTAVNLTEGREVIFSKGRVKDAVLSTIAIPGIFPPFRMNGWELVDGGVLDPVPVAQARKLAPRLPVIAVSLNQALGEGPHSWMMPIPSILPRLIVERLSRFNFAQAIDVFVRSMQVENRAVAEYRLKVDDPEVIIRPDVESVGVLDHVDVHEVALLGERAVELALPELKRATAWPARAARMLQVRNEA